MKKAILILVIPILILLLNSCINEQKEIAEVKLEDMPLRDKIAQMLIMEGKYENLKQV